MNSRSLSILRALFELIICFLALLTKLLADAQSEMIFKRNQKVSYEWGLLKHLFWSNEGNDFSIITFGGFTFITATILLSRIFHYRPYISTCEKLLLTFGAIFFLLEGFLVFLTAEYVPASIRLNAIVLGSLSIIGAIFFLADVCLSGKLPKRLEKSVQTDTQIIHDKDTGSGGINDEERNNAPVEIKKFLVKIAGKKCNRSISEHTKFPIADEIRQTHL